MTEVIMYMQSHVTDMYMDFNMLAAESGMSIDHFRHEFKRVYNLSPLQYFHKLKIEFIKKLMHNREYAIGDIAKIMGFDDLNYFSRFFKKHVGISPSEYKKISLM